MQRLFVSDIIGDEYTNWKGGDNVLISTLTGSGKTTFVFEKLLPFAAEHKKHIVYLCNRKSLNAQITRIVEESFKAKVKEELREYIHIRTYQHSEMVHDYPDIKKLDEDNKIVTFKKMYFIMFLTKHITFLPTRVSMTEAIIGLKKLISVSRKIP